MPKKSSYKYELAKCRMLMDFCLIETFLSRCMYLTRSALQVLVDCHQLVSALHHVYSSVPVAHVADNSVCHQLRDFDAISSMSCDELSNVLSLLSSHIRSKHVSMRDVSSIRDIIREKRYRFRDMILFSDIHIGDILSM